MGNKKIPSVLGVFIVILMVAALFVTTNGVDKVRDIFTNASGQPEPKNVTIANISNNSFTVFWTTDTPSGGAVFYGTSENLGDGIAVDQRDLGGAGEKYQTHFVIVNGLSESTKYYFKIGESDPAFGPYDATTGPKLDDATEAVQLSGKVTSSSGFPVSGSVASWQAPGASKIASLVKSDGTYVLPISNARVTNLSSAFAPESGSPEKIIITGSESEATINCTYGEATNLPTVQMGKTISCSDTASSTQATSQETSTETQETKTTTSTGFKNLVKSNTQATSSGSTETVDVNIESGESVSTSLPTFSGKAGPKQKVKIVVHSEDVYSGTVIAKPDGSWSWTPPANLTPGEHTVTITVVNADGTTQTVNRTFTVNSGESILPITAGTPSATITSAPLPDDELIATGVEAPTILALTLSVLFITLSIGTIFIYGSN